MNPMLSKATSSIWNGNQPLASSPVIIVGAGPTGLTAANLLGLAGIETLILERNASVSDCPKAISLDDEGLRICQAMRFGDAINSHIISGIDAHYISGNRLIAKVSPTSRQNGHPLISTFFQPRFVQSPTPICDGPIPTWRQALGVHGLAGRIRGMPTRASGSIDQAKKMIAISSLLGKIVMPRQRLLALGRDALLLALNAIPAVRASIREARPKPQPRYKQGWFPSSNSNISRALTGYMLPQPEISLQAGHHVLLDELLGDGFAVIRLHDNPSTAFAPLTHDLWTRLQTRFVCVSPTEDAGFTRFLRNSRDLFILIRPDRHILGVFDETNAGQFVAKFEQLLAGVW
jgi:hypothetical protein